MDKLEKKSKRLQEKQEKLKKKQTSLILKIENSKLKHEKALEQKRVKLEKKEANLQKRLVFSKIKSKKKEDEKRRKKTEPFLARTKKASKKAGTKLLIFFKNQNFKKAYLLYAMGTIFIVVVGIMAIMMFASEMMLQFPYFIEDNYVYHYLSEDEKFLESVDEETGLKRYVIVNEHGEEVGYIQEGYSMDASYILKDNQIVGLLTFNVYYNSTNNNIRNAISTIAFFLCAIFFIVVFMMGSKFFYRLKMEEPIKILQSSSQKIAENDLNFSISYNYRDEFGNLVYSFEKMRKSLHDTNMKFISSIEEKNRLNSSFAHDLRTPLTVMKGNLEILKLQIEAGDLTKEELVASIKTLQANTTRLENYTYKMSRLQKLEDISVKRKYHSLDSVAASFFNIAQIVLKDKAQLEFSHDGNQKLFIDADIAHEIFENLIANSKRFVKNLLKITLTAREDGLTFIVEDDGPGFTQGALKNALSPFFKENENVGNFGLGLYISATLARKHEGLLTIVNGESGGGKITTTLSF